MMLSFGPAGRAIVRGKGRRTRYLDGLPLQAFGQPENRAWIGRKQ
jgi:hypothetical protein